MVISSREPIAPRRRDLGCVLVFALLVRAGVLLFSPDALRADPDGYRALAENLVEHGTLGSQDHPTAYRPPLYPCLLAACVALGPASRAAIGLMHLALGLGTVWLTFRLGQRFGLGRWAWLAAVFVACDPILLTQSTQVMTETPATFLAVAALGCLTATAERRTAGSALAAGLMAGLCALCRPTFLPWAATVPFVLLVAGPKQKSPPRSGLRLWAGSDAASSPGNEEFESQGCAPWRLAVVFVAALAATLCPWAIRNQVQFGRPILATTHGGYTLLLANNPFFYEYLRSAPWGAVWENKQLDRAWLAKVPHGQTDEPDADRLAYVEALKNIRNEPATFCYACLVRLGRLFGVMPHQLTPDEGTLRRWLRYGVALWYGVELAMAVLGIGVVCVLARRRGNRLLGWIYVLLLVACFAAVHSLYWTDMRMRAPLVPAIALAAGVGVCWLVDRTWRRNIFSHKDFESPQTY